MQRSATTPTKEAELQLLDSPPPHLVVDFKPSDVVDMDDVHVGAKASFLFLFRILKKWSNTR